jgi:hypothetical protein
LTVEVGTASKSRRTPCRTIPVAPNRITFLSARRAATSKELHERVHRLLRALLHDTASPRAAAVRVNVMTYATPKTIHSTPAAAIAHAINSPLRSFNAHGVNALRAEPLGPFGARTASYRKTILGGPPAQRVQEGPHGERARLKYRNGRLTAGPRRFRELVLFQEYFHGDDGSGVGASHQTGWTGLVAKLIQQSGEERKSG